MTRPLLFLAASAVLATALGCEDRKADQKAKWRAEGRAEGDSDLAAGKLRLKTYGLPVEWSRLYHQMARDKLGLEFDTVAGCVVDDELVERAAGYNEPMRREIDRRYGPGALESLAEAARAEYQREQDAKNGPKP
jgi:hypothetical protein